VVVLGAGLGAAVVIADGSTRSRRPHPLAAREAVLHRRHRGPVQSERAVNAVLRYTPLVAEGTGRRRLIALTFDDGPSQYTRRIVRILVRMHVAATFFVVGQQLNRYAGGLRDELRHGFVIGDHTENHMLLARLPAATQYGQIRDDAIRLDRLGAPWPRLFRPPYGIYSRTTMRIARRLRMLMVVWSVDTQDYRRPGARAIVANVLSGARPGAIVLLHDGGGDRSQDIAALPAIIRGLRRRHYRMVTVPRLLRLDPPPRGQRLRRPSGA
jgi:peptidoglycan/xylan/chitin deacetylase (PgdA/CDA1 family)